jgi:predicted DCC family thiol-disulfide oxidoreductase YuxK
MYTLIYDGDCRMCTRLVNALRVWDSRRLIEIVPSQVIEVRTRFPWIPAQAYADALQLVGPDGETWQGSAAVERLLGVLPRGRWIAWTFHIPFMRGLADKLYRWVARNRYRLGCSDHCRREPSAGS